MKNLFGIDMLKFGLLGKKLGHSLSPFIHTLLFDASGITAEYKLYQTDDVTEFWQNADLDGFNVTIPYKVDIYNLCSDVHSSAANIGAVNCVDSRRVGYNTDVYGYTKSVAEVCDDFGAKVLLLGCGGAGSMVAKQYEGKNLVIAVRNATASKISSISKEFGGATVCDISQIPLQKYRLLCNATPVGMAGFEQKSPVGDDVICCADAVYDLIYNPQKTPLLSAAERLGKRCKNGLDMLVYQAAKSHKIWYGGEFEGSDIAEIIRLSAKELDKSC